MFECHPLSLLPFTSGEKDPADQGRHGTVPGMEEEQQGSSAEVSGEWYHQCLSSYRPSLSQARYHQCLSSYRPSLSQAILGTISSIKGELWRLVSVVASQLSGYDGYSQTPWVRVPQLPVFRFSPFSPSRVNST